MSPNTTRLPVRLPSHVYNLSLHANLHVVAPLNIAHHHSILHNITLQSLRSTCYTLADIMPQVPEAHPSAVFIREKALVIHLESTRMVIAKDAVYVLTVPSALEPNVGVLPTADAPLVKDLTLRLSTGAEPSGRPLTRCIHAAHLCSTALACHC